MPRGAGGAGALKSLWRQHLQGVSGLLPLPEVALLMHAGHASAAGVISLPRSLQGPTRVDARTKCLPHKRLFRSHSASNAPQLPAGPHGRGCGGF